MSLEKGASINEREWMNRFYGLEVKTRYTLVLGNCGHRQRPKGQ